MKTPKANNYLIALLFLLMLPACTPNYVRHSADKIYHARQHAQLAPLITPSHPTLSIENAYAVQRALVKKFQQDSPIAGFKGGLTGSGAAQRFDLQDPVVGVLFESGKFTATQVNPRIARADFNQLMLEVELGFVFSRAVTRHLNSSDELKAYVAHIVPAVELPDLGFANMPDFKGVDLIANNVSAHSYILGAALPLDTRLDDLTVRLYRDGELIIKGVGRDAAPGQWQAALWLCNKLLALGYTIKPGQVLLTGALGKMVPGTAGHYQARYGDAQLVEFRVD